jgi:pyrroline-5-carboxylate reductase
METIGFVGGGNMAEALIKGIIEADLYRAEDVFVSDIRADRLGYLADVYGVGTVGDNSTLAAKARTIVLSVKPQNMAEALESIKDALREDTLLISIAAGIKTESICAVLGDRPVVRVMPNTPALIGEGASALFANNMAKAMLKKAESIFSSVGLAVVVEQEDLIDAVTAVSGSGPAYYLLLSEEIIKAAVELGLAADVAKRLVLQTARGAALLAVEGDRRDQSPAQLRQKVTSPGGTTEAALKVLVEGKFGLLVSAAVKRAEQRSRELSG